MRRGHRDSAKACAYASHHSDVDAPWEHAAASIAPGFGRTGDGGGLHQSVSPIDFKAIVRKIRVAPDGFEPSLSEERDATRCATPATGLHAGPRSPPRQHDPSERPSLTSTGLRRLGCTAGCTGTTRWRVLGDGGVGRVRHPPPDPRALVWRRWPPPSVPRILWLQCPHRPRIRASIIPPVFVAIARQMVGALVGLEPTRPGAEGRKSGERCSTAIHRMSLSPARRGKAPLLAPSTSTDRRALGYTLATFLDAVKAIPEPPLRHTGGGAR